VFKKCLRFDKRGAKPSCPPVSWLTFESNVQATKGEGDPLQVLAERLVVMRDNLLLASAKGQRVKVVRLLAIVVGAYRVHPQDHLFATFVLKGDGGREEGKVRRGLWAIEIEGH
jgi:negative regulator of replication initiation